MEVFTCILLTISAGILLKLTFLCVLLEDETGAVVCDFGRDSVKFGFSGQDAPSLLFSPVLDTKEKALYSPLTLVLFL